MSIVGGVKLAKGADLNKVPDPLSLDEIHKLHAEVAYEYGRRQGLGNEPAGKSSTTAKKELNEPENT